MPRTGYSFSRGGLTKVPRCVLWILLMLLVCMSMLGQLSNVLEGCVEMALVCAVVALSDFSKAAATSLSLSDFSPGSGAFRWFYNIVLGSCHRHCYLSIIHFLAVHYLLAGAAPGSQIWRCRSEGSYSEVPGHSLRQRGSSLVLQRKVFWRQVFVTCKRALGLWVSFAMRLQAFASLAALQSFFYL